ncbi:MAG: tryptophan--tRNA ligase [Acidimicrobiales bacterium]
MARVFSGMKPTGDATLGSLLGALRPWVDAQGPESVYCVVDLHALTLPQDPEVLRRDTLELAMLILAVGIDPDVSILFVQSHVHEHAEMAWLMECTAGVGELRRMTQFKDKSARAEAGGGFVSGALFTYPALMAGDILLYDTEEVPVGDDQRQHVELTRDLAERFNARYGPTFAVPRAVVRPAGARVMDLQDPLRKMSKSEDSPAGTILLLEEPAAVARKIKRAVTDTGSEVRYDPRTKPGVSNLLSILAACTGRTPEAVADGSTQDGPGKAETAEAVTEVLAPVQARCRELQADPAETVRILAHGADRAQAVAARTWREPRRPSASSAGRVVSPSLPLFALGYPVAVAVIARWVPVVQGGARPGSRPTPPPWAPS